MKDIAFKDNTITKEDMPFPIVLYPGHYGAFFGFKMAMNGKEIFFCSCTKVAIKNHIQMVLELWEGLGYDINDDGNLGGYSGRGRFFLDNGDFPKLFVDGLKMKGAEENKNVIKFFNFESKLCHECNKATPSYRYCHEMYGGAFKQNYGWYIKKQAYEWGLRPSRRTVGRRLCLQDLGRSCCMGKQTHTRCLQERTWKVLGRQKERKMEHDR